MIRAGVMSMAVLLAVGCGGGDEPTARETQTSQATRTDTAAETRTPEPAPKPELKRARSVRECARLWNADALPPENYQVSANEFVADLAPVRVEIAYQRGHCFVVAPMGNRQIAIFTAPNGRRPFSIPDRRGLGPGERVRYNGRADRDGRVILR